MNTSKSELGYGFVERRLYMNFVHNEIIKNCEAGTILDFGCGRGWLKNRHPGLKIINYDIIDEFSEVKDYKILNPDIIICCHVLEHLKEEEIRLHLINFKKMKFKKMIVATPTENKLSKLLIWVLHKDLHDGHITKLKKINQILEEEFLCVDRKKVFTMTEISIWVVKNERKN